MVSHMVKNGFQNWDEMDLGGSVWAHIEGIRRCTVDLDIDNPKNKEYIEDVSLKMVSRFWDGSEKYEFQT